MRESGREISFFDMLATTFAHYSWLFQSEILFLPTQKGK